MNQNKQDLHQVFNLKVSDKEKTKEWYENILNYYVPFSEAYVEDEVRLKTNYEIFNGDIDTIIKKAKKHCDPLDLYGELSIEDEMLAYPKLHNSVSILEGEKLKRREEYKVLILSAQAIKDKDEKLLAALNAVTNEKVALKLQEQKLKLQGMPQSEIQAYIEELKSGLEHDDILAKDFKSEWEIFVNKAIKYAQATLDLKTKQMLSLRDHILNDRFFIYTGWKFGEPTIEERNTLNVKFHKSPNEFRVHKGDWIAYIDTITPTELIDEYQDELNNDDLQELGLYKDSGIKDKRHSLLQSEPINQLEKDADLLTDLYEGKNTANRKEDGLNQTTSDTTKHLVYRTHLEFKAYKKVIFLSYNDQMGEPVTVIVRNDYDIPDDASKIKFTNKFGHETYKKVWMEGDTEYSAEIIWIPRKYEVTRLGRHKIIKFREVPYQVTNIENPYKYFSLSTKGAVFNARNAESISIFERAIPLYLQYLFIKQLQNRQLANYQGYVLDIDVDQIPEALGRDADGNLIQDPIKVALAYQKYAGKNFYSSSQSGISGLPNYNSSPGSKGQLISTAMEIFNLQQLLELIDKEMNMVMGISPQRQAEFSSNTNVSDNQQAIAQSHHITEPIYYYHSVIWADVYKDYVQNFRTYAENILLDDSEKHTLEFYLEDGTKELFTITPKSVELVDYLIYPTNGGNDIEYQNLMKNYAQAFSQNPEGIDIVSSLLKSITTGASAEETHKLITLEKRKQEERMAKMEQRNAELQERMAQKEVEKEDKAHANQVELAHIKGSYELQKAAMNNTARQEEKDADNDGIPDYVELYKEGVKAEIEKSKVENEKSKIENERNFKEKELELKKEEINIKKNQPKS